MAEKMRRSIRLIQDHVVFWCVSLWMIVNGPREYIKLLMVQLKRGAFPVRISRPSLANEKFFWRKMIDHDPRFITITDKQAAKEWVVNEGLDVEQPETLWVGTDANEIPEDVWNTPFFLKATHGCNMNIPVLDETADRPSIIAQANAWIGKTYGKRRREWAYQHIPHRLVAERSIARQEDLVEIKCFTYGSRVEFFMFLRRRPPGYGSRWNRQPNGEFARSNVATTVSSEVDTTPLPKLTDRALELAEIIGAKFDHMRVDFLIADDTLYLGELTGYHNSGQIVGMGHLKDAPPNRSWDLTKSWFLKTPQTGWRKIYADALKRHWARHPLQ